MASLAPRFPKLTGSNLKAQRCWVPPGLDAVPRRVDPFVPQVNLSLAAMMRHVNVHREHHFATAQVPIRRVVLRAESLVRQAANDRRAIVERVLEKLPPFIPVRTRTLLKQLPEELSRQDHANMRCSFCVCCSCKTFRVAEGAASPHLQLFFLAGGCGK